MYTTVKAAIKDILEKSKLFAKVLAYEPAQIGDFPAACITADSHSAQDSEFSTIGNPTQQETYSLKIRLYYGLTQSIDEEVSDKQEQAETTMCELADKVIELLVKHRDLNGSCDYAQPISSRFGETERELIVKYVEITIQAVIRQRRV